MEVARILTCCHDFVDKKVIWNQYDLDVLILIRLAPVIVYGQGESLLVWDSSDCQCQVTNYIGLGGPRGM